MFTKKDAVFEFVKDASGKALIFAGLFSIVVGLLYVSPMGSLTCGLGLFLGVLLIDVGFAVQFEWFRGELRSKEGVGNLLMGIAPLLIAGGAVALIFAEPDWSASYILPRFKMGFVKGSGWAVVVTPLVRVYLWIAVPLAIVGVVLFVVGFLIRLSDVVS